MRKRISDLCRFFRDIVVTSLLPFAWFGGHVFRLIGQPSPVLFPNS